jgi:hypothetical protein
MITEKNYVGNGINGLSLWYMVMPRGRERSDGEFEPAIMIERWIKVRKERAGNRHQQKQGSYTPARCYPKDLDERRMGKENLVRKLKITTSSRMNPTMETENTNHSKIPAERMTNPSGFVRAEKPR